MVDFAATNGRTLEDRGCIMAVEHGPPHVSQWFPSVSHLLHEMLWLEPTGALFVAVKVHETRAEMIEARPTRQRSST